MNHKLKILLSIFLILSIVLIANARKRTHLNRTATNANTETTINYTLNACQGVAAWDNQTTYSTAGQKVIYEGNLYQNKWWTKGDVPGADPWGPWENLGLCEANELPLVNITSPANNAEFVLENTTSITIDVSASDPDGTIASVQIEVDGQTFNGNQANWSPTNVGTYTIIATATDDKSATSTAQISVIITSNQPVPPTVFINSPTNNATIEQTVLSPVNISVTANDTDGTISSVSIDVDGQTFNGTSANWTPSAFGSYTITATATDNDNLSSSVTAQVTIQEKTDSGCTSPEYESYPTVYSQGDIVVYEGNLYEALVNNLYNVTPGTADHWWKPLGPCVDTNTPPSITTSGDITVVGVQPIQLSASATDAEGDAITLTFTAEGNVLNGTDDGNGNFSASWTPSATGSYPITVNASDAKGASSSASFNVTVEEITGPQPPVITSVVPADGSNIKQTSLSPIQINVAANDVDGTISLTEITVGGNTYSGSSINWTPSAFGAYTISVRVVDNDGLEATATSNITVSEDVAFTDRVLVGYWHNWDNASAPYIRLRDVNEAYNVVCIAFAEPKIRDVDNTMVFDPIDITAFQNQPTDASRVQFKEDVIYLQSQGRKVLLSLGGANGVVHLDNATEKQKFVTSMIGLIDEYGFDGVDIDLEGSSLTLGSGDTDFKNPTTPRIVNFIDGIKQVYANYGESFMLTSAPETAYVQGGGIAYGGAWGGYLPILYSLKDDLDYVHVQLYNTGSITALDGQAYTQATADFIVSMSEMMLQGFDTKSIAGAFPAFRQDQVAIGLPANPPAAPAGGYTTPAEVRKALDYLTKGISFGGNYTLVNPSGYPNLRGMMTWSVNWDKTNGDEYANNYITYFGRVRSKKVFESAVQEDMVNLLYPNPFNNELNLQIEVENYGSTSVSIFNLNGQLILNHKFKNLSVGIHQLNLPVQDLENGLYLIKVRTAEKQFIRRVMKR